MEEENIKMATESTELTDKPRSVSPSKSTAKPDAQPPAQEEPVAMDVQVAREEDDEEDPQQDSRKNLSRRTQVKDEPAALNQSLSESTQVDRQKTCPFLVKVCFKKGSHNQPQDILDNFSTVEQVYLYTWKDATLREITCLLGQQNELFLDPKTKVTFRHLYQNTQSRGFLHKDLGVVFNFKASRDENKTLMDARFYTGDVIDVAIYDGSDVIPNEQRSHSTSIRGRASRSSFTSDRSHRFNPMGKRDHGSDRNSWKPSDRRPSFNDRRGEERRRF